MDVGQQDGPENHGTPLSGISSMAKAPRKQILVPYRVAGLCASPSLCANFPSAPPGASSGLCSPMPDVLLNTPRVLHEHPWPTGPAFRSTSPGMGTEQTCPEGEMKGSGSVYFPLGFQPSAEEVCANCSARQHARVPPSGKAAPVSTGAPGLPWAGVASRCTSAFPTEAPARGSPGRAVSCWRQRGGGGTQGCREAPGRCWGQRDNLRGLILGPPAGSHQLCCSPGSGWALVGAHVPSRAGAPHLEGWGPGAAPPTCCSALP